MYDVLTPLIAAFTFETMTNIENLNNENGSELINISEPATIRNYFLKVRELRKSGNSFPVNLDDVFPLVYSQRGKAVSHLRDNFIENEDYIVISQMGKKLNNSNLGKRTKQEYCLSVSAMEFFVAKKVKAVFDVYREVFHKTIDEKEKPLSQAELFLQSAQILLKQEKRISEIENKVNAIIENQETAKEELFALPFNVSEEKVPELSTRDKIRRMVNKLSVKLNLPQNDVWNKIYQELYYCYSVSIKAKKKISKSESWLDVAERTGNLDKMYIVVSNIIK